MAQTTPETGSALDVDLWQPLFNSTLLNERLQDVDLGKDQNKVHCVTLWTTVDM